MQHRYVALLLVACTFATLCPSWAFAQNVPQVVLSEIQWGGSALSTADEWLELANTTDQSIDIGGWSITGIGSSETLIILPPQTTLASHEIYLIANYAQGDPKSVLSVSPQLVTSSVSIPNNDLAVSLLDLSGAVVDSYIGSGTPDFGSTSPHAAMERNLTDGSWFTSLDVGTPGSAVFPLSIVPEIATEMSSALGDTDTSLSSPPEEEKSTPHHEEVPTETILETSPASEELPEDILIDPVDDTSEGITLIAPVPSTLVLEADTQDSSKITQSTPDDDASLRETTASSTLQTVIPQSLDYSPLQLNEFLSNPSDGNEWIELWNAGDVSLDLANVLLVDASEKQTTLSGTIAAHEYALIENPAGKLNNSGDTISLLLSDGQILVTLTYGTDAFLAPEKGFSAGACDDGWHTTLVPSPDAANPCPSSLPSYATETATTTALDISSTNSGDSSTAQGDLPSSEGTNSESTPLASITTSVIDASVTDPVDPVDPTDLPNEPESPNASTSTPPVSPSEKKISKSTVVEAELSELDTLPSGQHVHVSGILVAVPGVFGKRIAYLNGVQLYFHKADWPELAAGTTVEVTGVWDVDTDNRRIKISAATDIVVLGTTSLTPAMLSNASTLPSLGDILVTATGTLTKKEGDLYIFAAFDGSEFRVHDSGKTGALAALHVGDTATVIGMLFAEDGVWTIAPRTTDDVRVMQDAVLSSDTDAASIASAPPVSPVSSFSPSTPLVGGGILASSVSALGYWFVRSRKFSFFSR